MAHHRKEKTIITSAYVVVTFLLFILVPKDKIRQAQIPFLFKQVITWFFGLLVVEKDLIQYPYRPFFKKTNKSSFCFEFFIYPALCVIFNLYFPVKRNIWMKLLYISFHTSIITAFEIIAVKYTKLIRYKNWKWYWSFLTIWCSYSLSHLYYRWFFKDKASSS